MSVNLTRKELEEIIATSSYKIPSTVFELRYIKLNIMVNENRGEIWIYAGRERDYILLPGVFCSCKDFILRTVINKTSKYCKHQLGVYIAISRKKYVELNVKLEEAYVIMQEILDKGFSISLRRMIAK
ncbi:MAG: SWIM zinc finger family protein [Desulfurococcaceae archaeon]